MPKRTGQGDEWDYGAIIAILTAIIVVLGAATFMLHRDSRLNASGARLLRRNRVRGEKEAQRPFGGKGNAHTILRGLTRRSLPEQGRRPCGVDLVISVQGYSSHRILIVYRSRRFVRPLAPAPPLAPALLAKHFRQIEAHEQGTRTKDHSRTYCTIPDICVYCHLPIRRPTAVRISHERAAGQRWLRLQYLSPCSCRRKMTGEHDPNYRVSSHIVVNNTQADGLAGQRYRPTHRYRSANGENRACTTNKSRAANSLACPRSSVGVLIPSEQRAPLARNHRT